ncbi:MAG: homoserine dehydrogenase [Firmicutes bacterium]|nr:homoserine dehydrogenase [Bacillota bacterium]
MSSRLINIGLLGLGTVGRGVYRILRDNGDIIERRAGAAIRIKKILVRDLTKDRGIDLEQGLLTGDVNEILDDPEISIVVELLGGTGAAYDYALAALGRGKSLVTANKDMVAGHGRELFALAEEKGCDLFFEGSVAGGIPIIRPLKDSLAANRIRQVIGIINGTTNYMLTRMTREGLPFADVLKEAQALGYAEADPAADVEGYDAARKLAILASIAFNTRITLNDVYVEGITRITSEDIAYASELNYTVKLLGIAKETGEGVEVRVHPALLPKNHPLAAVNDVYNAIFVSGDAVGDVMFYGRGAGELPTASAVVADIIDASRDLMRKVPGMIGCTCFEDKPVKPMGAICTRYYIRLCVADRPGVLAGIARVFGNNEVSLAQVIQKTTGREAELVLVTHEVLEKNLQEALNTLKELPVVFSVSSVIRVEGES